MKKVYTLLLAVLLLNVSKAQDTIPFLDPCFSYPVLFDVNLADPTAPSFPYNAVVPLDSVEKFNFVLLENVPYHINNRYINSLHTLPKKNPFTA